jgi:hypothetical protein
MDSLNNYRKLIKRLLNEYAELENRPPKGDIETQVVFDETHDRYMMFRMGWLGNRRIRTAALYVRLQDDKIWIEEDLTEDGLATDLLAAGVPKEDIVLAFHHPAMRPYTEFAVA